MSESPFGPPPPAPPVGYANVVVVMRAGAGPAKAIHANGPAVVAVQYGDGETDSWTNTAAAGEASWVNPDEAPPVVQSWPSAAKPALGLPQVPQPSDGANLDLGTPLAAGPEGIANVAVFFTDSGLVRGVQFNGQAIVTVVNEDGSYIQFQNAIPSGTPQTQYNPSGT